MNTASSPNSDLSTCVESELQKSDAPKVEDGGSGIHCWHLNNIVRKQLAPLDRILKWRPWGKVASSNAIQRSPEIRKGKFNH
jgi:hypothetical protein